MKICELFRSVQGEGITIGKVTYFIRTVGCNLRCKWCDTKYSYIGGQDMAVPEIMDAAKDERNVCVTGGEPLLQGDIYVLLNALIRERKKVVLETNGSVDISNVPVSDDLTISMDIKCPSSGMSDKMLISNLRYLKKTDQLKFVIGDDGDMDYTLTFLEDNEIRCNKVLSPVGGVDVDRIVVEVVKRDLDVRVLPQLHKIIWGDRRGV